MGIRGLLPFLRKKAPHVLRRVHIEEFRGERLALDGTLLSLKVFHGQKDARGAIAAWHNLLVSLRHHGIDIVCFYDGPSRPSLKLKELARRRYIRSEAEVRVELEKDLSNHFVRLVEASRLPAEVRDDALRLQMTDFRSTIERPLPVPEPIAPDLPSPAYKLHRSQKAAVVELEQAFAEYEKEPDVGVAILGAAFESLGLQSQARSSSWGQSNVPIPPGYFAACRQMTAALGVPSYQASGEENREGEEIASSLTRAGTCRAVATEDTDVLAHGASLLAGLSFREGANNPLGQLVLTDMHDVLDALSLTADQFVDFCILCGSDYPGHVRGIGPVRGLELIKQHGDIKAVVEKLIERKHSGIVSLDYAQYHADLEATRSLFMTRQEPPALDLAPQNVDEVQVAELLDRFPADRGWAQQEHSNAEDAYSMASSVV